MAKKNWLQREVEEFRRLKKLEPEREILIVVGPGAPADRFPAGLSAPNADGKTPNWDWVDCREFSRWSSLRIVRSETLDHAVIKLTMALRELPDDLYEKLAGFERKRRLRARTSFAAGAMTVTTALAGLSFWALLERDRAIAEGFAADSRRVASGNPARALDIALRSWDRRPNDSAELAVRAVLAANPPQAVFSPGTRFAIDVNDRIFFAQGGGGNVFYGLPSWEELFRVPTGHAKGPENVWTPVIGSRFFAARGHDDKLRIWDSQQGTMPIGIFVLRDGEWESRQGTDSSYRFSIPSGEAPEFLKVSSESGYARLEKSVTRQPCDAEGSRRTPPRNFSYVICQKAKTIDGPGPQQVLFAAGTENALGVAWRSADVARKRLKIEDIDALVTGHLNRVFDVALSPDNNWLATASTDNTVIVTNLVSKAFGAPAARLQPIFDDVTSRAIAIPSVWYSPQGRWLFTPGKIWRTLWQGTLLRAPRGACIETVPFGRSSDRLFAFSESMLELPVARLKPFMWRLDETGGWFLQREDAAVKGWREDRPAGEEDLFSSDRPARLERSSLSPDGTRKIEITDGELSVVDTESGEKIWSKSVLVSRKGVAGFSRDGAVIGLLAYGIGSNYGSNALPVEENRSRMIEFFDSRTGDDIGSVSYPDRTIVDFDVGPQNRVAVLAVQTGAGTKSGVHNSSVWDIGAGVKLSALYGDDDFVEDVAISPDGRWIATVSSGQARDGDFTPCGVRVFECPYCLSSGSLIEAARRLNARAR